MEERAPVKVKWKGKGLVRQALYAALLVAVVMAAGRASWFGAPAVRAYAVFFLTEALDARDVLPRLEGWAAQWGWGGWPFPWPRGPRREEPAPETARPGSRRSVSSDAPLRDPLQAPLQDVFPRQSS